MCLRLVVERDQKIQPLQTLANVTSGFSLKISRLSQSLGSNPDTGCSLMFFAAAKHFNPMIKTQHKPAQVLSLRGVVVVYLSVVLAEIKRNIQAVVKRVTKVIVVS